jgi:hypothetical protein
LSENKERETPVVIIGGEPIREPVNEPIREPVNEPIREPEWLKRIEHMEQLQEKMAVKIEQIFQRLLSITPSPVENTQDTKIGDIDE